jgi:hypothetical protein
MDVYLIPVNPDRYELYCEHVDTDDVVGDVQPSGRFAALYQKFKAALARVEQENQNEAATEREVPPSWTERMKDRGLRWIAEKIAEQRLLWRLRKETSVTLFHPDDLSANQATDMFRDNLQREADRHFKWMIIDGLLFVLSGLVALIPGPNILAYYFGFRLVGHYLSRRGATHGLQEVQWTACASQQLSRLRHAIAMDSHERDRQVHQVASELHLPHLAKFFERTSIPTA